MEVVVLSAKRRLGFLAILMVVALFLSVPSLRRNLPEWWAKIVPVEGMRLGLDLQGGMYLTLKVNLPRAIHNHLELSMADLKETLHESRIGFGTTETIETNRVRMHFPDVVAAEKARKVVSGDFPNLELHPSAPVTQGESFLDLSLKAKEIQNIQDNSVAQSVEVIRNRIDQFGVSEPFIVRQGKDEIVVQLPGIKDAGRAIELIGRTAQLEFKLVDMESELDLSKMVHEGIQSGQLQRGFTHQELNRFLKPRIPVEDEAYLEKRADRDTGEVTFVPILVKRRTILTGEALKTARVEIGGRFNEPLVAVSFNPRGAHVFERITGENVGKELAIILDDIVQSAPVIEERIAEGKAQITGAFTSQQAADLAIVLRAGALPAPVDIIQNLTVGPSLGQDSVRKGLAAAVLGTILVIGFMTLYYRISGIIANFALLLNVIFMFAALSLLGATLTLPGIAGFVLAIGMAVDSNVLIFERMREESLLQKPLWSSVKGGYSKALRTIIDSHVTTLITAFALFLFGTGPIKGFAVTLSLGVILNLFTALYGTRAVYDYLKFKQWVRKIHFLQIIKNPHIDFIRLRNIAFLFSGLLVALGLLAFLQIERGHANLGVDFTGGTVMQFRVEPGFRLDDIRNALSRGHLSDYELQEVPKENVLIVRVKKSTLAIGQVAEQVNAIFAKELPQIQFTLESKSEIGSSVSKDLRKTALIAIAISMAGILLYLAWRFDLRFGVAAAIATLHDVLTVLGIFYLLDKEITLLVVTALLTLAGYSLTDTVVVFDRIRENLSSKGKQSTGEVINRSINEVLSRTVITSGTVFMVILALLLLGGVLLHDFALALMIGVIVGTYSSIFVASPIVYMWPSGKRAQPQFLARTAKHHA
ncbi:MAG: protein-export rane protein SecD [Deltaproteobacteria bacterium]|jgi:SecD/SecF fusion protein|nr:protein-export rane protein SecD [Deltaproteobacteria bacterium]